MTTYDPMILVLSTNFQPQYQTTIAVQNLMIAKKLQETNPTKSKQTYKIEGRNALQSTGFQVFRMIYSTSAR